MADFKLRQDAVRLRLLRYLCEQPNASTRDMAVHLGVSNGAAFYLVKALLDKGLVKAENFSKSNKKIGYLYLVTPAGLKQKLRLTEQFITIKRAEYNQLRCEIEAMETELIDAQLCETR